MIGKLVSLLLLLILPCIQYNVVFVSGKIRCIEREREALLTFKQGLVDKDGELSTWGSEDEKKECCTWSGVQCSNTTSRVIRLEVHLYGHFGGEISPSLLELKNLKYLDLSFIDFGGNRIPKFMGSMKMLQYLSLSYCNLSGTVPQQLGNLTNLVTLDLSLNSLRVENLNWLSHLSSLSKLDLGGNYVSDTNWPQQVLMLHSLKELGLSGCELIDGTHSKSPYVNSSSTSLSFVDLSRNYLPLATLDWLFNIRTIVNLYISNNQLDGLIPDSIGNLTSLKEIYLFRNKLKGGIPKSLKNHSHLRVLDLSQNDLVEPIGDFSCKALEYLSLNNNQLHGSVPHFNSCITLIQVNLENNNLNELPTSFAQLAKLEGLDVSNNLLEGTISQATFMELHNLRRLDLSLNVGLGLSPNWNPPFQLEQLLLRFVKLGPQFPSWLQVMKNLSRLDLSYTGISNEVPNWMWNFSTTLYSVKLSHNDISGTIPNVYLESLSVIDVSSNALSGPLPFFHANIEALQLSDNKFSGLVASICNIRSLFVLDISYNQFSGELPNCWKNFTGLYSLNLASNNIFGEIPRSLGFVKTLRILHLNDNSFFGELPSTLKKCKSLVLMDVGGNKLTGNVPNWMGAKYIPMRFLILRENRFYGNIPHEICNLTQIQVLDLSNNKLSGKVPKCLNSFASLMNKTFGDDNSVLISFDVGTISTELDLNGGYTDYANVLVQWKRKEWEYQKTLGLLKLIDISNNQLVGNIPRELFQLKGLVSLNLSRNALEGNIPSNIGHMEMLESLDLSENHLSGAIPIGLTQLHYLQVLDLSHNNLSGKIPSSTQLQSFNQSTYDGNAQLCGRPLALCPGDDFIPTTPNSEENDTEMMNWFMSLSFVEDFCISMAFGFILGFWGLIGSLVLKRSWRIAYFNFFSGIGEWMYVKIVIFLQTYKSS